MIEKAWLPRLRLLLLREQAGFEDFGCGTAVDVEQDETAAIEIAGFQQELGASITVGINCVD